MKQIIKYMAVAFALFLSAAIIGSCITAAVGLVQWISEEAGFSFTEGDENRADETTKLWYKTEEGDIMFFGIRLGNSGKLMSGLEEFQGSEIGALDIECGSGELIIETWDSDMVAVEYENISERYEIGVNNGTLIVKEKAGIEISFWSVVSETPRIHIKVPVNSSYSKVVIDRGSGSLVLDGLTADRLRLDSGSGSVKISNVTMADTTLDTGSGTLTVKNSVLGETKLEAGSGFCTFDEVIAKNMVIDSGSGRISYTGELTGNCVFDSGSGSVNLDIYGEKEEYNIRASLGSGGLYINGSKETEEYISYADADNLLIFDAGSGRISIKFHKASERNN